MAKLTTKNQLCNIEPKTCVNIKLELKPKSMPKRKQGYFKKYKFNISGNKFRFLFLALIFQLMFGHAHLSNSLAQEINQNTFTSPQEIFEVLKQDQSTSKEATLNQVQILEHFDNINANLHELSIKMSAKQEFNKNVFLRVVRSPFTKRSECKVSKDKITGLQETIRNQLSSSDPLFVESNCEYTDTSNDCNELIKLIQCGVNKLKNNFIKATANQVPYHEYVSLKNTYDDLIESYNKVQDDLKQSVSQEVQAQLDSLKTNIQILSNDLNLAIEKLQKQTIDLCISEIHSGKIDNAKTYFDELDDESLLPNIIEKSYNYLSDLETSDNYKKLDNFDNIVNFVSQLEEVILNAIGYSQLYESMKSNNHLKSPKILVLSQIVHDESEFINLNFFFPTIKNTTRIVIDEWATNIRKRQFDEIIEFSENAGTYGASFRSNLPDIIKTAYKNDVSNAENIILFVRKLPNLSLISTGYSCLYDNMKINNHLNSYQLVMLALRVKEAMEMSGLKIFHKQKLNDIKNKLPSSVQHIIWHQRKWCIIKNKQYNEYLYATNGWRNYWVYSWVPGTLDVDTYWEIENEGFSGKFSIKNTNENRYLYGSHEFFAQSSYRNVHTVESVTDSNYIQWRLIPKNGYFFIQNYVYDDYLMCTDMKATSQRRSVYSIKNKYFPYADLVDSSKMWTINC